MSKNMNGCNCLDWLHAGFILAMHVIDYRMMVAKCLNCEELRCLLFI